MMASTTVARRTNQPARRPQTPAKRQSQTAYATYTVTDAQTPSRPQARTRPARQQYTPPPEYGVGRSKGGTSNSISVLEAEFLATMFLIFLTVFTDQTSSYGSKMLAVFKRMTLASILFFILGLMSTGSENTAKFAKAVGALVLAGTFLGTAGQGTISAMDEFFKADWTQGSTTEGDSSANATAGQQTTSSGNTTSALQRAEQAALNAVSKVGNGVTGTASNNAAIQALQRLIGAI